jgi:hypothetical protein
MARIEDDREDLIREATALKPRVEWKIAEEPEPVFTGLKRDGSLSIYFGQNPVYQFNPQGQLRRAWIDGYLYRTQGSTLAKMHRERTETKTYLIRTDLTAQDLSSLLHRMDLRLSHLSSKLKLGHGTVLREVCDGTRPDFANLIERVLSASPKLAPTIPGRS